MPIVRGPQKRSPTRYADYRNQELDGPELVSKSISIIFAPIRSASVANTRQGSDMQSQRRSFVHLQLIASLKKPMQFRLWVSPYVINPKNLVSTDNPRVLNSNASGAGGCFLRCGLNCCIAVWRVCFMPPMDRRCVDVTAVAVFAAALRCLLCHPAESEMNLARNADLLCCFV